MRGSNGFSQEGSLIWEAIEANELALVDMFGRLYMLAKCIGSSPHMNFAGLAETSTPRRWSNWLEAGFWNWGEGGTFGGSLGATGIFPKLFITRKHLVAVCVGDRSGGI
jgi:hypothetical protein